MTELNFKGKEFVFNHHLAVPFRPLEPHPDKGIGPVAMDGDLIVQGDNTGNEGRVENGASAPRSMAVRVSSLTAI